MGIFEIQAPDGKTYEIDAPDQATALNAWQSHPASKGAAQPRGALEGALSPFTNYPSTYTGMKNDALGMMGEGVEQAQRGTFSDAAIGAGKTALGGLGYVTSPINAALRTFAGQPIQENTGIPKEYTEFAASMALPMPKRIPGVGVPAKTAPSIEQLKDAARGGYQSSEVTGLSVQPRTVAEFAQATKAKLLAEGGLDDVVAKGTIDTLSKLEKAPPGMIVTGQNLDSLRKTLGHVAEGRDPVTRRPTADAIAARKAIDELDAFVPKITPKDTLAGNPSAAAETWDTARQNWGAAARAETIDQKMIQAELRAAAANSGGNVANTVRQRMADVLINPALKSGYSADELAQMEQIVRGTGAQNALRRAGKFLGGGGGLGSMATSGFGAGTAAVLGGGPATVAAGATILPAIGYGLNALSNKLTMRQIDALSEAVRSRAPLAKSMEDFGEKMQAVETSRTTRNLSRLAISAQNLSHNIKDAGISISPADLFKALQGGASKAGADQNQQQ
jgi:hypothetical protein